MHGQSTSTALLLTLPLTPTERLAALFDTHHARLYRLARRLTRSADDALDLVQETFLRAARAPGTVPVGDTHEEAWLVRVMVNLQRDRWRHAAVRQRHDEQQRGSTTAAAGHEQAVVAHATVWRALDHLAPRRRAVIVLHELDGMDSAAIASLLGISRITVRWHLARAHRDLARLLGAAEGATHARR